MRESRYLFIGHLLALIFGLGGLLIALRYPALWAGSPAAAHIFGFGMRYTGALHILLGAAAMLIFGLRIVGVRETLIFFGASTVLSLGSELLGTGTGWPFGAYSYTAGLGFKIADLVPYTIPLSWFYMGFASYLLARRLVAVSRMPGWCSVALGVWFLTVWDLVLDPAMAHPSLPVQFWIWNESGPYFGMPIKNVAGWAMTGLLFMALSHLLWRKGNANQSRWLWLPLGMYVANIVFAAVLSLSVGLWVPPLIAIALGLAPILLVFRGGRFSDLRVLWSRNHTAVVTER